MSHLPMKLSAALVALAFLVACSSKDKKPAGDQVPAAKTTDGGATRAVHKAPPAAPVACPGDEGCAPCTSGKCEWDEHGRITSSVEWACDAPAETRTTFRYDDRGNLIERAEDDGLDGTIEHRETFTWDAHGNKLSVVEHQGTELTRTETWTYDAAGNALTYTFDIGERIERTTYEQGRAILVEQDDDGDGTFNRAMKTVYDDAGNKVRWQDDRNNDGTVDQDCTFAKPCAPPYADCQLDCR